MAFEGFQLSRIDLGEVTLRVRHGGSGPPLLLLHGCPQTHMMWGRVAGDLARDFTVVAPDLRGYGESSKPPSTSDHEPYSKRAMARDAVGLMAHFGFNHFDVAGHDRGGRVTYRMALDHPRAVRRISILDIVPTGEVWSRAERRFALGSWHWSFLAQAAPIPERIVGHDPDHFFFGAIVRGDPSLFDPEALADYLRCNRDAETIRAVCEDYRAGAGIDRRHDLHDQGKNRIACPLQVLWGGRGWLADLYDVMGIWRDWATDVRGEAIDCGHFLAEEKPMETYAALRGFFTADR
jgi:haloacetate dehalogenase